MVKPIKKIETMPKSHVVIAGIGRSGTTFLMELFTELGLETGFEKSEIAAVRSSYSHAGFEYVPLNADYEKLPWIIKSPYFYKFADEVFTNKDIEIEHVLIPIRNLQDAANSRRKIQLDFEAKNGTTIDGLISGGLTGT